MANIKLVGESEAVESVVTIYNDIKKTFGMDFVPSMFRARPITPLIWRPVGIAIK